MDLVEREEELVLLRGVLDDCVRGKGNVVVVNSGIACGKTELTHSFADHAAGSGAVVLTATCSQAERDLPFGVLRQLFRYSNVLPDDGGRFSRALDGEAPGAQPGAQLSGSESETIDRSTATLAHEFCAKILDLAVRSAVVIIIDDVHHADIASLHCLLQLIRLTRSSSVAMMLTEVVSLDVPHPMLRAELLRQPHCRRVQLAPLTERGVATVLTDHFDTTTAGRLAVEYFQASGGNPLLVRALLEDHRTSTKIEGGRSPGRLVMGDAFSQAVLSCVHRSEPVARHLAGGLAVLGEFGSLTLLRQLLGLEAERTARILQQLTAAGLLEGDRFRQRVVESAILGDLTQHDRTELHRKAAQLLYEHGAGPITVAKCLLDAGEAPDPWAVPVLQEAAQLMLAGNRPELAVEYLELAYSACPDERSRATINALLAGVAWRLDPAGVTRLLPALTVAVREEHLPFRHTIMLMRYLLWYGNYEETANALRWVDSVSDRLDAHSATDLRAVQFWLTSTHPTLSLRTQRPPLPAESDAVVPVTAATDPRLQAADVLASALTGGPDHDTVTRAEQVLQGCRLGEESLDGAEPALLGLLAMIFADRPDMAIPHCDRLLAEAARRRAPTWQAILCSARAEIALRQGDLPTAIDFASDALTHISVRSWGITVGFPLATLLLAQVGMGRYEDATRYLDLAVPDSIFQSRYGLHYLYARGHVYLATKRHNAALADFLSCGELMRNWKLDRPSLVPWRTSAAQARLKLGAVDQARELVNDQLRLLGPGRSRTHGISLRILAAASGLAGRPRLLGDAVRILQDCGDQYEAANALADLGLAYRELGDHSQARLTLRRAWHAAKRSGAEQLCQKLAPGGAETATGIPAGDDAAGDEAAGVGELSDAERRVAGLAANGYSNREIAAKLYISVSTVEQHLTRVYRKLNIRRRRDLPTDLYSTEFDHDEPYEP